MAQQESMPNVFTLPSPTQMRQQVWGRSDEVRGPSAWQSWRWGPFFLCVEVVMEGSPAASAAGWAGWRSCCGSGRVTAWTSTWTRSPACGSRASNCWTLKGSTRWGFYERAVTLNSCSVLKPDIHFVAFHHLISVYCTSFWSNMAWEKPNTHRINIGILI